MIYFFFEYIYICAVAKMTGLVGVPQTFVDDLYERLQQPGMFYSPKRQRSENTRPRNSESIQDLGYFGVSHPVLCLPLGSTVAWHLRPTPNPIYPVYLRSNLLNTNQGFDYGAFR